MNYEELKKIRRKQSSNATMSEAHVLSGATGICVRWIMNLTNGMAVLSAFGCNKVLVRLSNGASVCRHMSLELRCLTDS